MGGAAGSGGGGSGGAASSCKEGFDPVPGATGKIWYVATTGSDASGNGAIDKPYATLKKAAAASAPGDAIEVRGGQYAAQASFEAHGTPQAPVHIRPYPGEAVVFDAINDVLSSSQHVLHAYMSNDVVIEGFEVRNSTGRGISYYDSTNITIRGCTVHDIAYRSIGGSGENILIEGNEVFNGAQSNKDGSFMGGGWPGVIQTYVFPDGRLSKNVVVRNNHVHDSWGECIIAGFADGFHIEGNRVHDCYSVGVYVDTSRNVTIERNQIYTTTDAFNRKDNGNRANGISVAAEDYGSMGDVGPEAIVIVNNLIVGMNRGVGYWHDASNGDANNSFRAVRIMHNVVMGTKRAPLRFDEVPAGFDPPTDVVVSNNVFYRGADGGDLFVGNPSAFSFASNVWPSGIPADAMGPGNLATDPMFIAPNDGSDATGFRLKAGSSCVGAGMAAAEVQTDFWCAPRSATAPSIGLHEP